MTQDAKPEKLTAEQALYRKAMSGPLEPEENLRLSVILADDTGQFEAAYDDVVAVLAALDAARAETEAARRERDALAVQSHARGQASLSTGQENAALRALAAELVEAAGVIDRVVHRVEARCMAVDGPVTPTLREITEAEFAEAWRAANTIIARARALGIGGEMGAESDAILPQRDEGARVVLTARHDPGYHDLPADDKGEKNDG